MREKDHVERQYNLEQVPSNTTKGHLLRDLSYKYLYIKAMLNNCHIDHLKLHIMLGPNDKHGTSFYSRSTFYYFYL